MHHRLPTAFLEKYSLGDELGSGGFGFVLSAMHRASGIEVAVKFILREKVPSHAWVQTEQGQVLPMEIYVLKTTQHPSIIGYLDDYQDERFCYLVMELHGTQWESPASVSTTTTAALPTTPPHSPALSQTLSEDSWDDNDDDIFSTTSPAPAPARRTSCDLFECIERHHNFEESVAKMIFKQIVDCVAHLDHLGICHRDIKDENFVIDHQFKVKMIDFGSSVLLPRHYGHTNKTYLFEKFYGTVSFASPEILMGQRYRAEPAEIWSLGVLLYTLLFGEVPFSGPHAAVAGQCVPPKLKVSSKCLHLLSCLLDPHPDRRPTIHQVLMHPWFHPSA
ncbi:kinase-like domain-containing protein [Absidia repens]|uniref:Kinase-like domain-containing protein n=1 Tax=Absidia repens TaxID=90262 RepID=A0A1X2I9W0_9FUNG|nr:kinase-like domain-containing protein [Absidia repens]